MIVIWIFVGIILFLGLIGIGYYNRFIKLYERVKNSWSQIDVQLQRRMDLIPNLVETVKGYAKYEKETLENVINARNRYLSSNNSVEKMELSNEMGGFLSRLMAISEAYPDLKANSNFLDLQKQLEEIETKIGFSRQFYNDTVTSYNQAIKMFPANIVANIFNFKEAEFFVADEKAKENIQVRF